MGIQENMAEIIREIKESSGKSIASFSEELEISPTTLQGYLKAHGNPTVKMIEHLADKMGVDPLALISGKVEPEQYEIALMLLRIAQEVSNLPRSNQVRFAEIFLELMQVQENNEEGI